MFTFSNSFVISASIQVGSKSLKLKYVAVSSAYIIEFSLSLTVIKSLMQMLNNNGPIMDPCGTPVDVCAVRE